MKKLLSIFLLSLLSAIAFSQNNFDPEALLKQAPAKQQLVNDFTGTLTPDQIQALERKLVTFNDSTTTQIAVVIIPSLNGNDVSDYNLKLGRAWGVGGKEFNNGIVLLIAKEDHKLNIATGYGVEGALPDATCKQIIDDIITPKFKGNDFYRGIDDGTDAIMQAVKGEYTAPPGAHKRGFGFGRILFYIFIFIVFILSVVRGGGKGGGGSMTRGGFTAWTIGSMLGSGGGSGGGWGGGGGGGSFGGFGGGSFGGGGASGSW